MNRTRADRQPVPGIDHADDDREVGQLFFRELSSRCGIDIVRRTRGRDVGERLRPGESRALALRIEIGLVPGIEQVEARVRFAELPSLLRVHVQAVRTAVDLRHPRLYERDQLLVETAVLQIFLHAGQGGDTVGSYGEWVESLHQMIFTSASRYGRFLRWR